jgi:hypothetical protein
LFWSDEIAHHSKPHASKAKLVGLAVVCAGTISPNWPMPGTYPYLAAEPAAAAVNEVLRQLNPLGFLIALHMGALGAARAQQKAPGTIIASVVVLLAE